jgi:hypothetical protein
VVLQVDHAHSDLIVRLGTASLKSHLVPQHVAAGGVELQFVVVTEPMKLRPFGYGPNRREVLGSAQKQRRGGKGLENTPARRDEGSHKSIRQQNAGG